MDRPLSSGSLPTEPVDQGDDLEGKHLKLWSFLCNRANRKGIVQASQEAIKSGAFGSPKTSSGTVFNYMRDLRDREYLDKVPGTEDVWQLDEKKLKIFRLVSGAAPPVPGRLHSYETRARKPEAESRSLSRRERRPVEVDVVVVEGKCALGGVYWEDNPRHGPKVSKIDTSSGRKQLTAGNLARYKFPDVLTVMGLNPFFENYVGALERNLLQWNKAGIANTYILKMMVEFSRHVDWCRRSSDNAWLVFVKHRGALAKLLKAQEEKEPQRGDSLREWDRGKR